MNKKGAYARTPTASIGIHAPPRNGPDDEPVRAVTRIADASAGDPAAAPGRSRSARTQKKRGPVGTDEPVHRD